MTALCFQLILNIMRYSGVNNAREEQIRAEERRTRYVR